MSVDRIITVIKLFKPAKPARVDPALFSPLPSERLRASRSQDSKVKEALAAQITGWPANSPGCLNAWLLLVTTKEPTWRDPLMSWNESPLTLGEPHEGFFYPDPLGFWAEIRRWAGELFRRREPGTAMSDALALTTLLHLGDAATQPARARLEESIRLLQPQVLVFLDEKSWLESGLQVVKVSHYITDPHRPKQVYEGFWARMPSGLIVGKAPQHPTTHNLYRAEDMSGFLRSAPFA